jgi:hypothetical protein
MSNNGYNLPTQAALQSQLQIGDEAYLAEYGPRMVEAAECGIESQRRWTLHHMGCKEQLNEISNREWVRHDEKEAIPIPEAVFGLRARMFARLQEGVAHMAQLKPKQECPVQEDEMRHIAHALGHEFKLSQMRKNDRGYYVDAQLHQDKPRARIGMDHEEYDRHRANHKEWIDEDYRAHLGYRAVLLAAARDLGEAPEDPGQAGKVRGVFTGH